MGCHEYASCTGQSTYRVELELFIIRVPENDVPLVSTQLPLTIRHATPGTDIWSAKTVLLPATVARVAARIVRMKDLILMVCTLPIHCHSQHETRSVLRVVNVCEIVVAVKALHFRGWVARARVS